VTDGLFATGFFATGFFFAGFLSTGLGGPEVRPVFGFTAMLVF
jgi:hypothetical protein